MEKNLIFVLVLYDSQRRSFIDFVTTSAQVMCDYIKDMTERRMHDGYDSSIEVWRVGSDEPLEDIYVGGPDKNNDTLSQDYLDFAKKHLTNH